jgi:hypothetical protein
MHLARRRKGRFHGNTTPHHRDARPANRLRVGGTPMPVRLPTPEDLAALQVPAVSPATGRPPKVWTSKRDVSNFFHQLLMPE